MRRRGVPAGLLGVLALVAAIESGFERHALDFTRFPIDDWRVSGRAAGREASRCGIVCLGDSLVKFGILPEVLTDRLGASAYNLAVCDGQPPSSYFLLRRVLEAGGRPSAVVIDAVPHLLAADPRHNLRQWPELFSPREAIDIGWGSKHGRFCGELALGMLLPTVRDRYEIRTSVTAALGGTSGARRGEVAAYRRHWNRNRGAMVFPARPSYSGEIDAANPAYFPQSWRCHPVNERYLHRLLDLADSSGVRVYWLLPPVVPRFQARRDALGLEAAMDRFVGHFQDRYPNLRVIDARRSDYDHTLFIDALHLNRRGAAALSHEIASILETDRIGTASSRRIPVPAFRESRIPATLEDIEQSKLAARR